MVLQFLREHSGATAIEYVMIAALVSIAILGGAVLLGTQTSKQYNNVANKAVAAMK